MFSWPAYLCFFAAALVGTLATTPLAKRIAISLDAVDYPDARRINKVPIPRMGGIAIAVGMVCTFVVHIIGSSMGWWAPII